ncbi:MAG: Gfo/Idh/MocA family protein [Gaiellaceae bacterium]
MLGVAVVGAGGVGALHLAAASRVEGVRLVAVCDVDERRARSAAREYGTEVEWASSLEQALEIDGVDAVVVCTPNNTHAAVGRAVLEAGKHVLMEKPLALDLESADELLDLAAASDLVLACGHTHRHYDYARAVYDAIPDSVGEPVFARLSLGAGWIWGGWDAWVLDPVRSGGHILHNGVHGIDLVSWWLRDRPVEVAAVGQTVTSGALPISDYFEVVLRFSRGAGAVVEMSRGDRPKNGASRSVVVTGDLGMLSISGGDWGGEIRTETDTSPLGFDGQAGFDRQLATFASAASGGDAAAVTSGSDGRVAVAVALAAERSIREGRAVPVSA